jgi:pre-mRNA-processing factor SLU7
MNKEEKTPEFIKQLPWYAQDSQGRGELVKIPGFEPRGFLEEWYSRGQKGFQSNSYRKGACDNCGAMGHARKECTERPRKLGAKFSNKLIASDDVVKDIRMNWEVKRDRWNGYTPEMYGEVIEDFSQYEEIRKKVKGEDVQLEYKLETDPIDAANVGVGHRLKEKFQGLGGVRNR